MSTGDWNVAGATGDFTSLTGMPFKRIWPLLVFVVGAGLRVIVAEAVRTELPIASSSVDTATAGVTELSESSELRQVPCVELNELGAMPEEFDARGATFG